MNQQADATILTCNDIRRLATAADYFTAITEAFRSHAGGSVQSPLPMEIEAVDGAFHAKGASMLAERARGVKIGIRVRLAA